MAEKPEARAPESLRLFTRKVLVALTLAAAALLLYRGLHLLLLAFGAALVAVLLRALADPIRRHTPLNDGWSVGAAVLGVVALIGGVVFFVGEQIALQLIQLEQDLPRALAAAERQIAGLSGGEWLLAHLRQAAALPMGGLGPLAGQLGRITQASVEAVAQFVVVVVAGVYLAVQPRLYREGLLNLLPPAARTRLAAAAEASGLALRKWLMGTGLAMLAMGGLTMAGAALLGLPAPLALGLLSGLAEFVPILGAAVSAIPGLLLAAAQGPQMVGATLLFYVAAHQLEGHLLIPLIQRRVVAVPPAMTLFAVLGFGVLLGPLGAILATPLAVVLLVLVKHLQRGAEPAPRRVGGVETDPADRPRRGAASQTPP